MRNRRYLEIGDERQNFAFGFLGRLGFLDGAQLGVEETVEGSLHLNQR